MSSRRLPSHPRWILASHDPPGGAAGDTKAHLGRGRSSDALGRMAAPIESLAQEALYTVVRVLTRNPGLAAPLSTFIGGGHRGAPTYVDAMSSGLGPKVFRRAARDGEFRVFKPGKKWLARKDEVDSYIERCRVEFVEELPRSQETPSLQDPLDRAIAAGKIARADAPLRARADRSHHGTTPQR